MAQVEGVGESKKRHISTSMTNFPRDLLQRFISANHLPVKLKEEEDAEDELELTLGLSLNGRFGVDPRAKKIKRTASIPEFVNPVRDEDTAYVVPMAASPLVRTCSLPTETEEEWRRRKELQTLRRMEARRKRLEKQRNSKAVKEKNRSLSEEIGEEDNQTEQDAVTINELSIRGCRVGLDGSSGLPPPPCSQVSSGSSSNGTGSSGISESECQPAQGIITSFSLQWFLFEFRFILFPIYVAFLHSSSE